jgi:hypothetical protein
MLALQNRRLETGYLNGGKLAEMPVSPTRTVPASPVFASGRRSGGKLAVMPVSPIRVLPVSATSSLGTRNEGNHGVSFFDAILLLLLAGDMPADGEAWQD